MTIPLGKRTLHVSQVPVGTKVVLAGRRYGGDRMSKIETTIVKVTKTYIETDTGHRFNVSLGSRWMNNVGEIGGQRKSDRNHFPDKYRDEGLFLPDDPWLLSQYEMDARNRRKQDANHALHSALEATKRSGYEGYEFDYEKVLEAQGAIEIWLDENRAAYEARARRTEVNA